MCGITGILEFNPDRAVDRRDVQRMCRVIAHRGPDDEGLYLKGNVGMGVRRLSIIDLSTGHQPIRNEDGTLWIVYNGEVYNYREIRSTLTASGHRFSTATDTEVIIHLYEEDGPEAVHRLNGMFVFAIWDERKKELFLARDRLGVKPLYYAVWQDRFLFASEVKAFFQIPGFPRELDLQSFHNFLSFRYVPAPATMFKGISKLPPGHTLTVSGGQVRIQEYWDLRFAARQDATEEQVGHELRSQLREAVRKRLISDVPVGVLLSGGIDSSTILAMATELSDRPLSTFSIAFQDEPNVDELPYARQAAERFGTDHHEIVINQEEFTKFLPGFLWHMDEPVADPASIPLYYVSRLARDNGVIVVLSGEGSDELFAGYSYWQKGLYLRLLALYERLPGWVRGRVIEPMNGRFLDLNFFKMAAIPREIREAHTHSWIFTEAEKERLYSPEFRSAFHPHPSHEILLARGARVADAPSLHRMLYNDIKLWLPDDLLVKADKMTMAASVELRVPFLDHTFVEFAASLPPVLKARIGSNKYILKKAATPLLPEEIVRRKKMGFPVPLRRWLSSSLEPLASRILLSPTTLKRGIFGKEGIENLLGANRRLQGAYALHLFNAMTFELWCRLFLDADAPSAPPSLAEMIGV
ncbi:MAG: asparagine synthase (glutamine-hydrolyzing) [Candidatus Methylomirabilales bacterium]